MKLACIQMNSSDNWEENMTQALGLITQAAQLGAKLIALPECALAMTAHTKKLFGLPLKQMWDVYSASVYAIAKEYDCTVLAGSLPVLSEDGKKLYNTALLVTPEGYTSYRKIHLCDIQLGAEHALQESKYYAPGEELVVVDKLGLTICYDLRFPYLFRALAKKGAEIIAVPAAFTPVTGEAHWHALLKARAIENGCYVLAPAQVGEHPGRRQTYGHSLIISPWGEVLADAKRELGIIYADYDPGLVHETRKKVPSLSQDRTILA